MNIIINNPINIFGSNLCNCVRGSVWIWMMKTTMVGHCGGVSSLSRLWVTRTVMSPVLMSFELPETLTHPDQSNRYTITSQTKSQLHQPSARASKICLAELYENIIQVQIININTTIPSYIYFRPPRPPFIRKLFYELKGYMEFWIVLFNHGSTIKKVGCYHWRACYHFSVFFTAWELENQYDKMWLK